MFEGRTVEMCGLKRFGCPSFLEPSWVVTRGEPLYLKSMYSKNARRLR